MTINRSRIVICCALGFEFGAASTGQAQGPRGGPPRLGLPPSQAGPLTTVSGTVSQFNYDRDGEIEGFLLSNNTMVHLQPRGAVHLAEGIHKGDNMQVSGYAQASQSGMQVVEAQELQDRSSGKTLKVPQPGAAAPYSSSGRIQQLNYGPDGAVNGLLLENGTLAAIPPFSAANPSSLRVGAAVSYTGYARTTVSGRTVVDVQTVTINGQMLNLALAGPGSRAGVPPPPPPARGRAAGLAPAPDAGPAGRTDQPTPPPSPAQPPRL